MPTTVHAYGVADAGSPLKPVAIERRDVGPHDVSIDIRFCGICHSDLHITGGDFGPIATSPLVPGHEIVGVVAAVGEQVAKHAVGDLVGIGCMVDSCRTCENCVTGEEQYCQNGNTIVFGSKDRDGSITQGGYAESIVANEDFVLSVPRTLDPASAAPLLCAGITVYAPLKKWGAGPGKSVAVVGLGGLGHLGVKMAKAMGAEVTVLSRSDAKREAARELGADAYIATGDGSVLAEFSSRFDLILNTVSASLDLNAYLGMLRRAGTFASVGVSTTPMSLDVLALFENERNIAGSLFAGIRETQEMLDFCAEHGVTADVEVIAGESLNDAYRRVLDADVRYRFVLDTTTLR